MKIIELKFNIESIKDKEEKIIELYLMDNIIMKYIIREEMFSEGQTRHIEGEIPSMFKKYIGGVVKNGK